MVRLDAYDMLNGDFASSIKMNFMPPLIFVFFFLLLLQSSLNIVFQKEIRIIVLKKWMLWVFAVMVVLFWLVRNIIK